MSKIELKDFGRIYLGQSRVDKRRFYNNMTQWYNNIALSYKNKNNFCSRQIFFVTEDLRKVEKDWEIIFSISFTFSSLFIFIFGEIGPMMWGFSSEVHKEYWSWKNWKKSSWLII